MNNQLYFVPRFSLEPNKCTSYNHVFKHSQRYENWQKQDDPGNTSVNWHRVFVNKAKIKRQKHNFKISDNAYRTLKRRINWLYYLAKSKQVKTYSGKDIFNFKIGFVTLTLPSPQQTCTQELTNTVFNQFLTEIRQRTKMQNYVWRLEFQKNGNAHYHLVTDTYLDYFFVLKIWNRILSNYGYIQPYTEKFSKMSLSDYCGHVNAAGNIPFNILAKRYAKGKKTKWQQPNTVDVKSVVSKKAISNYLSKYFSKDSSHNTIKNQHDNEANSNNLRLWFCSRSLSKLKTVTDFCEAVEYDIFSVIETAKRMRTKFYKYVRVYYFDIFNLSGWCRKFVEILLKDYAKKQGYIPST